MQNPLGIIRRCEQSFLRARLEELGLMPIDCASLRVLATAEPCNQDLLCAMLEMDKGRIAKTAARLEELGFIHRVVNERNKREKLVKLSDEGARALDHINLIYEEWDRIRFRGFSDEERAQYTAFLERIAQNTLENRREEKKHG